jgi:TonB family protein
MFEIAVQQPLADRHSRRVSVQSATRKSESAAVGNAGRVTAPAAKKAKLSVLLVTRDDQLWPQIGMHLGSDLILKQVDSIDELISQTPAGQPAIVLLDARGAADSAALLSRLQLHSPRFAVVALDEVGSAHHWTNPIALRQVIAHVAVPIQTDKLKLAVETAHEEVNARVALLGESGGPGESRSAAAAAAGAPGAPAVSGAPSGKRRIPLIPAIVIAVVLTAGAAAYVLLRQSNGSVKPTSAAGQQPAPQASVKPVSGPAPVPRPAAPAAADEKVDLLIEKAQQAMTDRHFIDPAEGSALTLYRNALLLDPENGEARQGLQRLAEILFARVQSALDERKFDVALQALETARSINPGDSRLAALDQRIATLRAEFGPAQILAAINAQNFDRAAQLIDEAARSKSLNNAKLAQLRDELRRRHEEFDVANLVKLIDSRLSQDKLLDPRNDSAAYYLAQARAAGATPAELQAQSQEIFKRLSQMVRTDIDQRHFTDADRVLTDMHGAGFPAAATAGLQHDLGTARAAQAAAVPEQPQPLDLAQSRLAQGKLIEPDNDSALYYFNHLRAADPKNSALPKLSSAIQAQILVQARAALDANQPDKADTLLQAAGALSASADLSALNDRLAKMKLASAGPPQVVEASLTRSKQLELDYPDGALRKNIEGWVELSYVVTTDGKVTNVKVLDSNPAGVFDAAASKALSRMRYKPAMQAGKPTAVSTKLRIAFRVNK